MNQKLLPVNGTIITYVVRHGQTTLNKEGLFRGSANPPLDATGLKQAEVLADIFKDIEISHIFCSDKLRAVTTANTIGREKKIPVHQTTNLRALNVGDFSGTPRNPESEARLKKYLDDPDSPIPGGESLNDFKARVDPCLQEAADMFCQSGVPTLLVAHSSVVHEVGALLHGNHKSVLVEPGGVLAIYFNGLKVHAKPIFRPVIHAASQAATVT